MSLHAIAWLGLFLVFAYMAFRRASWGIPLYMLVQYASPNQWWWGTPLTSITLRWSLLVSLIFVMAALLDRRPKVPEEWRSARNVLLPLLLFVVNATVVHFLFASDPEASWIGLVGIWKKFGLALLLVMVIKDKFDMRLLILSILIGSAYIGYEYSFNQAGSYDNEGRIGGNHGAGWMAFALPLGGGILLCGTNRDKCIALGSLICTLVFIIRAISRGAYLGVLGAAAWLLIGSKGRLRKRAAWGVVLGCIGAFVLSKDDRSTYVERFSTIFISDDETRDDSSASRLLMWQRGLQMISDHPLGSGYEAAFKSDLGVSYISDLWNRRRSVHNGYLTMAAGWGVQGLLIYLTALALGWWRLGRSISLALAAGDEKGAFLGCCIRAALVTQLITCLFGSHLSAEHLFWWMAMAVTYERTLSVETSIEHDEQMADVLSEEPIPNQAPSLEVMS